MNWRTTKPAIKPGDSRVRRRFAWLPTALSDGYTVWLELYGVEETALFIGRVGAPSSLQWTRIRTHSLVWLW